MTVYNKVTLDGTTIMDISDTTAVASDVAQGKYFYDASGQKATGSSTAIVPSGTKSITSNGTNIDVTAYASVDVAVPSQSPNLGTKTITSNGTYNASSDSLDGYSQVTVSIAFQTIYSGSSVPSSSTGVNGDIYIQTGS